jgi:hypothetical protein
MVTCACTPSTQEAEAGGLQVPDQPGLHGEILSQKQQQIFKTYRKGIGSDFLRHIVPLALSLCYIT